MRSRIWPIAHKEWLHILRDWRTLGVAVALPLILLAIFGYGISFDLERIGIILLDEDRTPASRAFVERIVAGPTFDVVALADHERDLRRALDAGRATIGLHVRAGFSTDLARGRTPDVQFLLDGAENNTGMLAMGYLARILSQAADQAMAEQLNARGFHVLPGHPALRVESRFWFNPELVSAHYVVPGVIALVMMLLCALLTSQTIVRERERGTLEQLVATPVRPHEIVLGKLLPYFGLGLFDTALITAAGLVLFGVPFRGSAITLLGFAVLFATVGLAIGITISAVSSNQVLALQIVMISQMLPTLLLSGFMFPIKEMPRLLQYVTALIPARYVIVALRGIFLKGTGLFELWREAAILLAFAVVFIALAARKFRKTLE